MLAYDKKQIGRIHRILIPAVIFTAAVLLGRMDTIMADFGQSEPLAAGKALSFAFESLTTGNALLVAPVICAFPYGAACIDEVKSGMFKNVLYRTDEMILEQLRGQMGKENVKVRETVLKSF